MTEPSTTIDAALSANGTIPKAQVLAWIDAAADSDLNSLSKLYRLTGDGYYRIQPELGRETTCGLIQRYLLGCIREGVTGSSEIQDRYEAAQTLHVWFRQLAKMDGTSEVLTAAANGVRKLYLESGDDVRSAIENGFLEHALETATIRPYFEQWASDPRLEPAWNRALTWGEAHPDYMAGLFQRLQSTENNNDDD
jgi:hypothetical protein